MKALILLSAFASALTATTTWACGDAGSPLGNSILGIQTVMKEVATQEARGSKVLSITQSPDSPRTYVVVIADENDQTKQVSYEVAYNRGGCLPLAHRRQ